MTSRRRHRSWPPPTGFPLLRQRFQLFGPGQLRRIGCRLIAPDRAGRRRVARAVVKALRPFGLLACRIGDTRGHLELPGDEATVREAVRRVLIAIRSRHRERG